MNTASLAARKYNERGQFPEGVRINATKSEQDASKIFVRGLSPELSKQALLEYLSQFGEIIDFIIKRDPNTGLSRGFGFVLFEDSSTVEKVLQVKDHKVDGKKVEFKRAKAIESQFPIKKIFVGGLNPQMSEEKIRSYFGAFGQIEAIELPLCPDTKKRRAFGFIKYMEEKPVRKVLETRFHYIGSSRCEVKMALPKEPPVRQQQNKTTTNTVVRERKAAPTGRFESHWGGRGNQSFHFVTKSNAQEANLDAQKAVPYTLRANSNITLASSCGFMNTAREFQVNPNVLMRNSMALGARQNALGPNSNSIGVNNYTLGSNPNPSWENGYALGASPNSFRTSHQYTSGASPNVISTNQYPLETHSNAFGVSQWALMATPNVFCTNQYPLETSPNAFGVNQHDSGKSPNAFGASQYNLSSNSDTFSLNYYGFGQNPHDLHTSHYVLETTPSVFRTSPNALGANTNAFGANHYDLQASQNAFDTNQNAFRANENFCEATESGRSTEGLNLSRVNSNFLNIYNNLPDFRGSNGDFFFLYSYWAYDLESVLNSNVQINQSSLLGNRYQGIYSTF
ncbi:RNA-binding protein Musashi homolog Rbp6-like [Arvicola amphibius]|uniref:RNA-binding protein Musashi homolog Rbp6-like n=1 Tax=Arvicola amphibius TaxID=1047088 RepID=UPI0018E35B81|nr:RNA-binding protein Musashi homolog Rbp6-like [Arvicola amphibius]